MSFLYAAYAATWIIHISYLAYLLRRYARLRHEIQKLIRSSDMFFAFGWRSALALRSDAREETLIAFRQAVPAPAPSAETHTLQSWQRLRLEKPAEAFPPESLAP